MVIGGGVSLLASANPDGLEWSIQRITGETEVESGEEGVYATSQEVQEATSFLPDYTFKDTESVVGTSVSGIVGGAITIAFLVGVGYIIKIRRNKGKLVNE